MKKYLFDTNAISLTFDGTLPEKWVRLWKEVRMGNSELLLFEPLISEMYYKNIPKHGKTKCKDKIYWMKSLSNSTIHPLDDNDAFRAGDIKNQYKKFGPSIVDCFLLSVAKVNGAMIITTDPTVKFVAKEMNVKFSYLPFDSIKG